MSSKNHQSGEVDRVILRTPIIKTGLLRCPVSHHRFCCPPPTENYALVFPRTPVSVRRDDDIRFVADPSGVAFWNRGVCYSREALSDTGTRSDWFGFDQSVLVDVIRSFDRSAEDIPDRPFRIPHAPIDGELYLSQRRVILCALRGDVVAPLWFEESALHVLAHALRNAYKDRPAQPASEENSQLSIHEQIIHDAEELLRVVEWTAIGPASEIALGKSCR